MISAALVSGKFSDRQRSVGYAKMMAAAPSRPAPAASARNLPLVARLSSTLKPNTLGNLVTAFAAPYCPRPISSSRYLTVAAIFLTTGPALTLERPCLR